MLVLWSMMALICQTYGAGNGGERYHAKETGESEAVKLPSNLWEAC